MSKVARLIVSFQCERACSYCCNNYSNIIDEAIKIDDLSELSDYDTVCITGGEPMEFLDKTVQVIEGLKEINPKVKIYLYTAKYTWNMEKILKLVDGVHFTLHGGTTSIDIADFLHIQDLFKIYEDKSFRLFIHPKINRYINVIPSVWKRVEVKPWVGEEDCILPEDETLYTLEDRDA